MNYKAIDEQLEVLRTHDMAFIPADYRNRDWKAYRSWVMNGNYTQDPLTLQERRNKIKQYIIRKAEERIQQELSESRQRELIQAQFDALRPIVLKLYQAGIITASEATRFRDTDNDWDWVKQIKQHAITLINQVMVSHDPEDVQLNWPPRGT